VAQVLAYPAVDDTFTAPPWSEFADAPLLSAADARWFWEQYVGVDHPGGDHLAVPLRAESLLDSSRPLSGRGRGALLTTRSSANIFPGQMTRGQPTSLRSQVTSAPSPPLR
jgi:acetyl esterase/lipase